jgi:hypothetical protein
MMTPLRSNFTKTGELFDKIKQKYMLIWAIYQQQTSMIEYMKYLAQDILCQVHIMLFWPYFSTASLFPHIVVVHSSALADRYRFWIDLRQQRIEMCTRSSRIFKIRVGLLYSISKARSRTIPVVRSFGS